MSDLGADIELGPSDLDSDRGYRLITSLVIPRPIAWVSSLDRDGHRNLAPHSYFNIASTDPLIVHFTSSRRRDRVKDSAQNVQETGEFVVHLVPRSLAEVMNLTSAELPPEDDEFVWAGVEAVPSRTVRPPRVAGAPVALECRLVEVLRIGNGTMLFGEIQWIHIRAGVFDGRHVDAEALDPIARLGGSWYATLGERFSIERPAPPGGAGQARSRSSNGAP